MKTISIVSGYFNPLHGGHINLFESAKKYGDSLLVIINNDEQQVLKKGTVILNEKEREKIVGSLSCVDMTILALDHDRSVCKTLKQIRLKNPDSKLTFCNGGDRTGKNIPEVDVCNKLNIDMIFEVGGKKTNSSTEIIRRSHFSIPKFVKKSWGWEYWFSNVDETTKHLESNINSNTNYCGKLLYVEHGKWSSNFKFHYHKVKDETFMVIEGSLQIDYYLDDNQPRTIYLNPLQTVRVQPGVKHRFTSISETGCKFIEVSTFHSDEDSYRCQYNSETGEWEE